MLRRYFTISRRRNYKNLKNNNYRIVTKIEMNLNRYICNGYNIFFILVTKTSFENRNRYSNCSQPLCHIRRFLYETFSHIMNSFEVIRLADLDGPPGIPDIDLENFRRRYLACFVTVWDVKRTEREIREHGVFNVEDQYLAIFHLFSNIRPILFALRLLKFRSLLQPLSPNCTIFY